MSSPTIESALKAMQEVHDLFKDPAIRQRVKELGIDIIKLYFQGNSGEVKTEVKPEVKVNSEMWEWSVTGHWTTNSYFIQFQITSNYIPFESLQSMLVSQDAFHAYQISGRKADSLHAFVDFCDKWCIEVPVFFRARYQQSLEQKLEKFGT